MNWAEENRGWREQARIIWRPERPEPLLIRAWLHSPIAYDGYDPITLEGALQSVVCMRETGRLPDDVYADCPSRAPLDDTDIQIPIVDTDLDGFPVANISIGWFSPDAIASKRQNWKRARADHYQQALVKTSEAGTKTQMVLKQTVSALHVTFYALGDRDKLESLLRDVGALAAARSGGLGVVRGWEIGPAPGEWWFKGPGKRLMRTLPARAAEHFDAADYDERPATVRAPYWHHRTRCLARVPVQRLGEGLTDGAKGNYFVTPHAVERYRERIPGKRRLSYEEALGELINLLAKAHFVRAEADGTELWRVGRPNRLRFKVSRESHGLPQVLTVMMPFDRKPEVRA